MIKGQKAAFWLDRTPLKGYFTMEIKLNPKAAAGLISVEYPASLLREWKTSPITVDDNIIYQFHFSVTNFCSNLIV